MELDAATHRSGDGLWEVEVDGVHAGQAYSWAVEPGRPLLDPYALAVTADRRSLVVAPPAAVDWRRPATAWHESVVYELHARGFTRHESSGVAAPGTYRGLTEKIDHLVELGVTAVELLPVHEFDETEVHAPGLLNFWGYSPLAWFAPNRRYAASPDDALEEFRTMVRAFHAAGIQVMVDVVFNHTGEQDASGPTWSLRGLDEELYYLPKDLTGCGNSVRAQHPVVRALIADALRWWVHGLGVDGFRFDLATVLARDEDGEMLEAPALIREIEEDPQLQGIHLVAEAWDAAGAYRVGSWVGGARWAVWNDRFRDDVRRAWLHDWPEGAWPLALRLQGSSDIFARFGPPRGVNYVTAHDGLTLRDVVSYDKKHNEANGEENRDGHPHEVSASHGVEGPSDDADVEAARDRARRNLAATLLLAHGVPMLLAGDELGRTQRGNNNAYCHDSELSWVDWGGLDRDRDFFRFVRGLIRLRRATPALVRERFLEPHEITWFGPDGGEVAWESAAFGYRIADLAVLVNLADEDRAFTLPEGDWRLAVETAAAPPDDLLDPPAPWSERALTVKGRSLALLLS